MPINSAIHLADLRHAYGPTEVLDGISFDVATGAFVSIVGPSGCGKSTLLKLLCDLIVPTSGTAEVAERVGYMAQRDLLLPWKRALPNASLGAELAGTPRPEARATALGQFERFGLAGFERAWPSQLSGGMRQRLALLRTYLTGAGILLLDEPFGALDAITRRELQVWLQGLWLDESLDSASGTQRHSALLVTHDIDEALFLSDTVHVMSPRPGRLVATVELDAPRPRDQATLTTPTFGAAKAHIIAALTH